jgi:prepilin-type N-terminal cleavage/methylation domain-containing protein
MREGESGFTLIEVLVTIAVISILAAIALPSFFGESRKTKAFSEVQPIFNDMRVRIEQYLQENGKYPPTVGEAIFNPAGAPSTTKAQLDVAKAEWLPIKLRLSGEDMVYCRYTYATGLANVGTNIGTRAADPPFNFTAPETDWYYIIAKCDMDNDPAALSWYFTSSVNHKIQPFDEGK